MKKTRFAENQIVKAIQEREGGRCHSIAKNV